MDGAGLPHGRGANGWHASSFCLLYMLAQANDDSHPNAHACRLRFSLHALLLEETDSAANYAGGSISVLTEKTFRLLLVGAGLEAVAKNWWGRE